MYYVANNIKMTRVTVENLVKDLGVIFDDQLTFHARIIEILSFVLRNCQGFTNPALMRLQFNALVRCKLETSACLWNLHEITYKLML